MLRELLAWPLRRRECGWRRVRGEKQTNKQKSLNEPQGAPIKPGLTWIMAAHLHGVLRGRCHFHPQQSHTHEVESFFHLMNSSRSCLLESKDLKERVEQECEGREKTDKDLFMLCAWAATVVSPSFL